MAKTGKIVSREEVEAKPVTRARGASMAVVLGPEIGVPNFITRRFFLAPGGRIPEHRHPELEHEQVVIRGEMTIALDGEEHVVGPGDAVFIPAGCAHWYENRGHEPVEFLCVVPKTESYTTQWLEEPPPGAYLP
ncbi:MAG: cupin domain-containing protein [Thermoanaerobaculum sp.]